MKTIEELLKGSDNIQTIEAYDMIDLSQAVYVSASDATTAVTPETNKKFEQMAKQVKQMLGDKPVVVSAADAVHYNYINGNMSYYMIEYMVNNAKTWIVSTETGKYGRPVQIDHQDDSENTIGRVLSANPVIYGKPTTTLSKPDGHIELIYYIPAKDAIERIMDGRMLTLSVGQTSKVENVKCSVCSRSIRDMECEHIRGKTYEIDGKTHLCYWKWEAKTYKELSYVSNPADARAKAKHNSFINIQGLDSQDNSLYNYSELVGTTLEDQPTIRFMIGTMDKKHITNLHTTEGQLVTSHTLFAKDSVTANDVTVTDISPETPSEWPASTDNDCGCSQDDDTADDSSSSEAESRVDTYAAIGIIVDMLETNLIELDDAVAVLYDVAKVYVPRAERSTIDVTINHLEQILTNGDAELTATKRKRLALSTFCGPDRSWPVPDCRHVATARAYLNNPRVTRKYSSSQIARIRACVNRKAKALGCDKSNAKDNTSQEAMQMALTFNTEKELLESAPVMKALDEMKTSHEQEIDQLKQEAVAQQDKFKILAITSILDLATKLKRPIVSKLNGLDGEDAVQAKQEIVEKLKVRTFDSLSDSLNDLTSELELSQQQDSNDVASQAALEAATNQGIASQSDTAAAEGQTQQQPEEMNNDQGTAPVSILGSFTKKRE